MAGESKKEQSFVWGGKKNSLTFTPTGTADEVKFLSPYQTILLAVGPVKMRNPC